MPTEVKDAASQTAELKSEEIQSFRNQAEESKRKYTDLLSKHEALSAKIEALESKSNLSQAEKDRLEALENRRESIEDQKEKIRGNPDSKPWLALHEDISVGTSKKVVSDALYDYDKLQAQKMVKRTAKDLKIEVKEFEEGVADILKGGRWKFDNRGNENMPTERVEMAIDEWYRLNDLKEKASKGEEKVKALEAERSGRRHESSSTKKDDLEKAKETGNFQDILARKAQGQKEFYK